MNITVNISTLDTAVKRQLSVIGKRSVAKDGTSLFSDITPSAAEVDTLHDYYSDAIILLNTTSQYFVTAATTPGANAPGTVAGTVTLTFPANHNNHMNTTISAAFIAFLVAYAVYAWLSIVNPALVERYRLSMREKLDALIQLIYHKAPPQQEYTYDIPPSVNTPGDTMTLAAGEQRLMAYTLGSDGIDDLVINSSIADVVVSKNAANSMFAILNNRTGGTNPLDAVVTITRSGTNTLLERITVTALAPSQQQPAAQVPAIIGYNAISDSVAINESQSIAVAYTGTIDNVTTNNGSAVVSVTKTANPNIITISAVDVGSSVITMFAEGWRYTLYVTVREAQATSPRIDVDATFDVTVNDTLIIPYTLGSDGIDDLYYVINTASPSGCVAVEKQATSHRFVVRGVAAGSANIAIKSNRHPESNVTFTATVVASAQSYPPELYTYTNGDTVNTIAGASPIRVDFYPGTSGSVAVATSDDTKASIDSHNDYVLITPLAAGSATITFNNSTMEWTNTIDLAIAEMPAVVTPPIVQWPTNLELQENGNSVQVAYTPSNDGVDNITMESGDTSILTIAKNNNNTFTLTPHAKGTVRVSISDDSHPSINRNEMVEVVWQEPVVYGYANGDEVYIPEAMENPSDNPVIGTNAIQFTIKEASSGTTVGSVSNNCAAAVIGPAQQSTGNVYARTVTIKGLIEGSCFVLLTNGSWTFRLNIGIGEGSQPEPTPDPVSPNLSWSANSHTSTTNPDSTLPVLTNPLGANVVFGSSNGNVATISSSGVVTLVGNGTCTITATVYQDSEFTYQQVSYTLVVNVPALAITELPVGFSPSGAETICYYKGDLGDGVVNPMFVLSTGVTAVITADAGRRAVLYNESTGSWYDFEIETGSSTFGAKIQDIQDLLSSKYSLNVSLRTVSSGELSSLAPSYYIVPGTTPMPSIDGSIYRTINTGGSDTINISNGSAVSAVSSDTSVSTVSVSSGSVAVTAVAAGSTTVTITTNTGSTLTVSYTVQQASALPEYNGEIPTTQYNHIVAILGTVTTDIGIDTENPVVSINSSGKVTALVRSDGYFYKYNVSTNSYEKGGYASVGNTTIRVQAVDDVVTSRFSSLSASDSKYVQTPEGGNIYLPNYKLTLS